MFGKKTREQINNIKKKELEPDFEPSMKTLVRILEFLTTKGPNSRTSLASDTSLHYSRLAKHIVWMEKKGLVESKINKTRICVELTEKGKEFASMFLH
jgi:predicted transcriptional regulator